MQGEDDIKRKFVTNSRQQDTVKNAFFSVSKADFSNSLHYKVTVSQSLLCETYMKVYIWACFMSDESLCRIERKMTDKYILEKCV